MKDASPSLLRPATPADYDVIYAMYTHDSVNPFMAYGQLDREAFKPIFEKYLATSTFLVLEVAGKVVAMRRIMPSTGLSAHIVTFGSFAVHPEHRRFGYGRVMTEMMIKYVKENFPAVIKIELGVEEDNKIAQQFDEKMGFKKETFVHDWFARYDGPKKGAWYTGEHSMGYFLKETSCEKCDDNLSLVDKKAKIAFAIESYTRIAAASDHAQVQKLFAHSINQKYSADILLTAEQLTTEVAKRINSGNLRLIIDRENKEIIAAIEIVPYGKTAYSGRLHHVATLEAVAINPEYSPGAVAEAIKKLYPELAKHNIKHVDASVIDGNAFLLTALQSAGFTDGGLCCAAVKLPGKTTYTDTWKLELNLFSLRDAAAFVQTTMVNAEFKEALTAAINVAAEHYSLTTARQLQHAQIIYTSVKAILLGDSAQQEKALAQLTELQNKVSDLKKLLAPVQELLTDFVAKTKALFLARS